jgi:hypothetical protein
MSAGKIALPNPKRRKSHQRYVMFLMESPMNDNFPYEKFQGFFNWTMTFRKDSDIHRPYGWAAPKSWPWHYAPALGAPITWNYPKRSGKLLARDFLFIQIMNNFGLLLNKLPILTKNFIKTKKIQIG